MGEEITYFALGQRLRSARRAKVSVILIAIETTEQHGQMRMPEVISRRTNNNS